MTFGASTYDIRYQTSHRFSLHAGNPAMICVVSARQRKHNVIERGRSIVNTLIKCAEAHNMTLTELLIDLFERYPTKQAICDDMEISLQTLNLALAQCDLVVVHAAIQKDRVRWGN